MWQEYVVAIGKIISEQNTETLSWEESSYILLKYTPKVLWVTRFRHCSSASSKAMPSSVDKYSEEETLGDTLHSNRIFSLILRIHGFRPISNILFHKMHCVLYFN